VRRLCSGRAALARVLLAGLMLAGSGAAHATSLRYCDGPAKLSAAQQDRLLRVSAIIKAELEQSGAPLALVARSGLNLGLFGMRYSHAGLSLKAGPGTPWSVRQLYYACEDQQPRLFDQGMSAFLLGMDEPSLGFVSVVTLPAEAAAALVPVALDNQQVLQLLAPTYSANAYAFSVRYQNCNQWLAELLAAAWGSLQADADPRPAAQGWLKAQGYQATVFQLPFRPALWLTAFSPWLHRDDHPDEDLEQALFRVSMPASIETFVRARLPGAQRLEFCHTERHVVVRRGWDLIADGCVPGEQDQVILLQ
jgi:hypothetical protein